jgi:hypothetical protein
VAFRRTALDFRFLALGQELPSIKILYFDPRLWQEWSDLVRIERHSQRMEEVVPSPAIPKNPGVRSLFFSSAVRGSKIEI